MSMVIKNKKRKIILTIIFIVFTLICNYSFVNAETAKLNHENFNITLKNNNSDDEISIELENYDEKFTSDNYYHIIKITFKNNKIIEGYEEDIGLYSRANEDFTTKHRNDIVDKISLTKYNKLTKLKIEDLGSNEIGLAVSIDFQVTVYLNGKRIIDKSNISFDDNLFEIEGDNRYYYSNFEIDLANNSINDLVDVSIINNVLNHNFIYIVLAIFIIIFLIVVIIMKNKNFRKKRANNFFY